MQWVYGIPSLHYLHFYKADSHLWSTLTVAVFTWSMDIWWLFLSSMAVDWQVWSFMSCLYWSWAEDSLSATCIWEDPIQNRWSAHKSFLRVNWRFQPLGSSRLSFAETLGKSQGASIVPLYKICIFSSAPGQNSSAWSGIFWRSSLPMVHSWIHPIHMHVVWACLSEK